MIILLGGVGCWAACVKAPPPDKGQPQQKFSPVDQAQSSLKPGFQKPTLPPPRNKDADATAIRLAPSPSPGPSAGSVRQLTNEVGLIAYYPQQRLMPEDMKIGALQDGLSATRDYLRAIGTVRAFLDSIAKKEMDEALVLPAARAAIKAVVSYPLSQGYVPQRYRIGKIVFENESAVRANIRLYKDEGVTTGEIYLAKVDDGWQVSDLQAGFTLLGKKYVKPTEPFVPGSYKFLLGDH
jgi:hypothetical protein